jgi:hypothetical protein
MDNNTLLALLLLDEMDAATEELLLQLRRSQCRVRTKLKKDALVDYRESSFAKLVENGDDSDFLAALSLCRTSFFQLLAAFTPFYLEGDTWRPGDAGRPPAFHNDCKFTLGLILTFYRNTMELNALSLMFGLPPSTCSRVLFRSERALLRCLETLPDAAIRWPTFEQQAQWATLVRAKNELVEGRWGFIDGKNYPVQKPSGDDLQNAFYNGWLHRHLVTGTLCFGYLQFIYA